MPLELYMIFTCIVYLIHKAHNAMKLNGSSVASQAAQSVVDAILEAEKSAHKTWTRLNNF